MVTDTKGLDHIRIYLQSKAMRVLAKKAGFMFIPRYRYAYLNAVVDKIEIQLSTKFSYEFH